ncbi:MAG TPA: FAD-binding oxidoreductase [Spirochaetia bacterium]|nr:FAD-binding oxidoreductase [Spirochaetia bacterium]
MVFRVHHVRLLSEKAYVLRFDRHGLAFEPGQYVNLGVRGSINMREYSIYSGWQDDFLEVLVREIDGGIVSRALKTCEPGDPLALAGPYGSFVTDPAERGSAQYLFVGSGTGISPFHCLVRSYPKIDYLLLHGVRTELESFDLDAFASSRYLSCVSRSRGGAYHGRVTEFLREHPVDPQRLCYLCGNSDMIYEAFSILRSQGVPRDHLRAEIYF